MSEREKTRLALWFSVNGDIRYLSHRDTVRLWQRALVRSRVSLCYSQGFNPHPRLSLPLPRSVGMSARRELLLAKPAGYVESDELVGNLNAQLPAGVKVVLACYILPNVSAMPLWAEYDIRLSSVVDSDLLDRRIETFLDSSVWPIQRAARGRHPGRSIDLRSGVAWLERGGGVLRCRINIDPAGTVRIDELLGALDVCCERMVSEVTRTAAGWPSEITEVKE